MLTIKMIQVEGLYKALVLDLAKPEGSRLVELYEGSSFEVVQTMALDFIESNTFDKAVIWH